MNRNVMCCPVPHAHDNVPATMQATADRLDVMGSLVPRRLATATLEPGRGYPLQLDYVPADPVPALHLSPDVACATDLHSTRRRHIVTP